jgi:hypothetical protein
MPSESRSVLRNGGPGYVASGMDPDQNAAGVVAAASTA